MTYVCNSCGSRNLARILAGRVYVYRCKDCGSRDVSYDMNKIVNELDQENLRIINDWIKENPDKRIPEDLPNEALRETWERMNKGDE